MGGKVKLFFFKSDFKIPSNCLSFSALLAQFQIIRLEICNFTLIFANQSFSTHCWIFMIFIRISLPPPRSFFHQLSYFTPPPQGPRVTRMPPVTWATRSGVLGRDVRGVWPKVGSGGGGYRALFFFCFVLFLILGVDFGLLYYYYYFVS